MLLGKLGMRHPHYIDKTRQILGSHSLEEDGECTQHLALPGHVLTLYVTTHQTACQIGCCRGNKNVGPRVQALREVGENPIFTEFHLVDH